MFGVSTPRTRLSPGQRREQLLDLGVRLLAERSLEEISIDLLAAQGQVSRGLLYHYFGDKHAFREAVVRRAADDFVARTTPPESGEWSERLLWALRAYVDYVDERHELYLSLVHGAASDSELRDIYDHARTSITDLILAGDTDGLVPPNEAGRLLIRGWQALAEEMVLAWKAGESTLDRDALVDLLAATLPSLVGVLPSGGPAASH